MLRHDGISLAPDDLLFAPSPPEIGTILSAQTDAKTGQKRKSGCAGFLVAPLLGVFGFLAGMWISESLLPNDPSAVKLLGIAGAVTFALVAFALMRSIHPLEGQCSYVGTDGAVLFERKGKRVKTIALVPFKDVADVRVESTGHGSYGIHTSYLVAFNFVDAQGRTIARIAGMHFPDGQGSGSQSYWLGKRAHEAWQAFRLARMLG